MEANQPVPLEDLLEQTKHHWVECATFTRCNKPFSIKASDVPPIIAPKLRGDVIYNTEMTKKSLSVEKSKTKKAVEGN